MAPRVRDMLVRCVDLLELPAGPARSRHATRDPRRHASASGAPTPVRTATDAGDIHHRPSGNGARGRGAVDVGRGGPA